VYEINRELLVDTLLNSKCIKKTTLKGLLRTHIFRHVLAPSPVGEGLGEGGEKVLNEKSYMI